jgi:hypothetical protein
VADVPPAAFVDVVTDRGCVAAGLPVTYPREDGDAVGWGRCRPVGARAWGAGERGIVCRTATSSTGEELAWFQRGERLRRVGVLAFDRWFWPAADPGTGQPEGV